MPLTEGWSILDLQLQRQTSGDKVLELEFTLRRCCVSFLAGGSPPVKEPQKEVPQHNGVCTVEMVS